MWRALECIPQQLTRAKLAVLFKTQHLGSLLLFILACQMPDFIINIYLPEGRGVFFFFLNINICNIFVTKRRELDAKATRVFGPRHTHKKRAECHQKTIRRSITLILLNIISGQSCTSLGCALRQRGGLCQQASRISGLTWAGPDGTRHFCSLNWQNL